MADTCKVLLIGDGSVGKSSIIARFVNDGFQKVYAQTIGVDFFEKKLDLRGDKGVMLQIWDIGGQSISSKNLPNYVRGADVVFMCYDVTNRDSFDDLEDWLQRVHEIYTDETTGEKLRLPQLYIIGNKIDLISERQVTDAQHDAWWRDHGIHGGFLGSAQTGENVATTIYKTAANAVGIQLTDYELGFHSRVINNVQGVRGGDDDEGRTSCADDIEAADRAMELAKQQRETSVGCKCSIC
jgi:small GTP-binding protein